MIIRVDTRDLELLGNRLRKAPSWIPEFIDRNLEGLGRRVAYLMRVQLKPHRYTGTLEGSVVSQYFKEAKRVEVGPTAKRGKWDAGTLLQQGTGPIDRVPFEPIRRWAEFKGIPARPIWYTIKTKGVKPHPFVMETLERGDVQTAIWNTAKRIGLDIVSHAKTYKTGGGTVTLGSTITVEED